MASDYGSPVTSTPAGKMSHSQSLPAAVDAVSLPDASTSNIDASSKQRSGKMLSVTVTMLDDIQVTFHIQHKSLGQALFELVCKQLSLLEVDYFGLEYEDSNRAKYWLDLEKPMNRQLGLSTINCAVNFGVKFYTPDPAQLEEEYTRYLFCLQIKKDLMCGTLQCNDNTAALIASYIVQADCGDYVADDYPDHSYLASYKFVPHQDEEMERRIMENHKRHLGQSPAEADQNVLETVRRCELYGIRMHPAKDHEGVPLNLAVAHMGVLVFQNYTKINTFSWAKVRKLSFKRKRFLIKLHPEGYASPSAEGGSSCQGYYKDTVEFYFESRNECKNFWKKCVEHHGFFRCNTVMKLPRQKTRVLSRGSSFRYSGRTQKQIVDYVRENFIKRQPFQRSQSFRHSNSAHSGLGYMPNSRSSQPLYPVGDHSVGTPASHSCGSMVLNDDQSGSTDAVGTSPYLSRDVETDVCAATADVHSESMASGDLSGSPSSSPKRSSFDQQQQQQQQQQQPISITNGRMVNTIDESPSKNVNKGGENSDANVNGVRYRKPLPNQSSTDSPISHGSSTRDRADDSISQDSYQLLDAAPINGGSGEHAIPESEQEKGILRFEGDPGGVNVTSEIPYVLCKRTSDLSMKEEDVFISPNFNPTLPSVERPPPPPCKPKPRISVEMDNPKISQSSPTLYARSRLRSDESPSRIRRSSGGFSPKSPLSMDFVHLHSLPDRHSYSSKDDSLNGGASFENQIVEHLQRKKLDRASYSTSSLASTSSTQSSHESTTLEPLRIVEDGDDDDLTISAPFRGVARSTPIEKPRKSYADIVSKEDNDEWEKLAPTFPPPPPPPLQDISPPVEKVESIQEARNKFLIGTIGNNSNSPNGRLLKIHSFEEVSSDQSCDTDNDATVTVEESSDTGEQTTVVENPSARSVIITELDFDDDDDVDGNNAQVIESFTTFGVEDENKNQDDADEDDDQCVTVSVHDDTANGETESLPREGDLDDDYDDLEPCPPSFEETLLLYPVRTLSRISERSTSEQSESKEDSTPTQDSKPSEDRHASVGELPSDYSMSDDNADGALSSNDSDCSPSRGRAPGTGSGLGLSPIRSYKTVATIEPEIVKGTQLFYENRFVLSENDGDGSQIETYYMEIDSAQKEQLEKEGVAPYVAVPGEESSSADNDTLCEEHSFMESVDFLSDISPDDHWRDGAVSITATTDTSTSSDTHKELYEGLGVCIPARSPTSPLSTPEPSRVRHRTSVELQYSKGLFLENKPITTVTVTQKSPEETMKPTTIACNQYDHDQEN